MDNFIGWFLKKRAFFVSIILTVLFFIIYLNIPYNYLCIRHTFFYYCGEILKFFKIILMISPALLLFSVVAFKLEERVFWVWKKFTIIYLFIYLFIVVIFPWYIGDEFFNIQKAHVSIFLTIIYLIISLFLIIYKSLKKE